MTGMPMLDSGFKDMMHVEGKESEVPVRFDHMVPKEHAFTTHCHLPEHEDTGMMLPLRF